MSSLRSTSGDLAGGKGKFVDPSWRTAYLRKQAILSGQLQKSGTISLGGGATTLKPLIGNYHLQPGVKCGINELVFMKNKDGFM